MADEVGDSKVESVFGIRFQKYSPVDPPDPDTCQSLFQHAIRSRLLFTEDSLVFEGKKRDCRAEARLLTTTYARQWLGLLYRFLFKYELEDFTAEIHGKDIHRLAIAGDGKYHIFTLFQTTLDGYFTSHIFIADRKRDCELVAEFKKRLPPDRITEEELPWTYKTLRLPA